jgi:DeoR/GlpR family transcriptional regulator of sugar metabolism
VTPAPPTVADLLVRRRLVPDATLLDWAEVAALVDDRGQVRTSHLQELWGCSQSSVSRRLGRIAAAGLLQLQAGGGRYRLRPAPTTTNPTINP